MMKFTVFLLVLTFSSCLCETESITTVQPNYSVDQIENENQSPVDQVEVKPQLETANVPEVISIESRNSNLDEIQVNNVNSIQVQEEDINVARRVEPQEVKQVSIDADLNSSNQESATVLPEMTTVLPSVTRVKRAPRYTIRELLFPNGVLHEVGHLRDEAVNRISKTIARTSSSLERTSSNRVRIHHDYHHIPNHVDYLPNPLRTILGGSETRRY